MLRQARGLPLRRLLGQQRRRLSSSSPLHLHAVDSIGARLSRMVFVKLYEFFAVSFEHRRRVIRITRPCARKSGFPSSLCRAQPRRQRHHLVPDYFVYSSNSRRWRLLPRLLLRLRPPWRPSLLVPRRRRLVMHPPLHVRYWQHRCVPIVPDAFPSLANSGMCRPMA